MGEMPDSYRKANSVFPRAYFPMQMQSPPSTARGGRFFDVGDVRGEGGDGTLVGRVGVGVEVGKGEEGARELFEVEVPMVANGKKKREGVLNELGYRMSWSQSRVFAGRIMFLQKSRMWFFFLSFSFHPCVSLAPLSLSLFPPSSSSTSLSVQSGC